MEAAGIDTASERRRGLDHGVFIPLMLIYPAAKIPVFQISLQADLAPARHIEIGRSLAPLRDEGVLIIASGLSIHNVRALIQGPAAEAVAASVAFDDWLTAPLTGDPAAREAGLVAWAQAPGARISHPRAEHLLPLMVPAGAATGETAQWIYAERLGGLAAISGYRFG